jgi:1-acyl-sn-glycerol-3-phosphate acyltransferase
VFPWLSAEQRARQVQIWSLGLLRTLGITLEVVGTPVANGPALMVSNHVSWLDIASLHAARYCRFVSKSDISRWPLIGALAMGVGTLFVKREVRRDTLRVVQAMTESLQNGDVLAIFPEGTTSHGLGLLPFHSNLLQAAIDAQVPVQPLALQYLDALGQVCLAPSYVGDDPLPQSIWRTARAQGLKVRIHFGQVQQAEGRDRRCWGKDLQASVAALRTGV